VIERIELQNFKCFNRQVLDIGPLTLLAGLNGSGKSSVLQSLLLLRQSQSTSPDRWTLNGELTRLGTGADILFAQAPDETIALRVKFSEIGACEWVARYERSADVLTLVSTPPGEPASGREPLFSDSFNYLAAERIGPRLLNETSDESVELRRNVGIHGEFAVHYLSRYGDEAVSSQAPVHSRATSTRLFDQVEAWMSEISPGVRVNLTTHPRTDAVSIGFQFVQGKDVSNIYRATNVGFGLSYSVSLLVAVLAARPGSLILVENPEAHVHPQGQVVIGQLLAEAAAGGVQIIAETHSDHILNGVRVAVFERRCTAEAIRLHFFSRDIEGLSSAARVDSPRIDDRGRLDFRPSGFFDQWDKSLETLLGPQP